MPSRTLALEYYPDLPEDATSNCFVASVVATGVAFFGAGSVKGLEPGQSALRSGLETLLTGGAPAAIAFVVGAWPHHRFGTA